MALVPTMQPTRLKPIHRRIVSNSGDAKISNLSLFLTLSVQKSIQQVQHCFIHINSPAFDNLYYMTYPYYVPAEVCKDNVSSKLLAANTPGLALLYKLGIEKVAFGSNADKRVVSHSWSDDKTRLWQKFHVLLDPRYMIDLIPTHETPGASFCGVGQPFQQSAICERPNKLVEKYAIEIFCLLLLGLAFYHLVINLLFRFI